MLGVHTQAGITGGACAQPMGQRGLAIRVARGRCSRRSHSRHTAQPSCAPAGQAYPPHTGVIFIRGGGLLAPAVEAGP
eukprot:2342464-Prymnesium_polylepis.1